MSLANSPTSGPLRPWSSLTRGSSTAPPTIFFPNGFRRSRSGALKRLTRRTLEEAWRRREEARGDEARSRADGHWRDVVYHSVLDVLDQMDAVPWRIASWPYDACLAIDVAAGRRYFGLSLLVCRDPQKFPGVAGFTRVVDSWPKPDVDREAINGILLEDRIAEIVESLCRHRFPEIQSVLALRDGHVCGDEGRAIDRGLNRWMRRRPVPVSPDRCRRLPEAHRQGSPHVVR